MRHILFILVHTMEELKLTGNHLKGSRPLLTFSTNLDKDPHWKLLKEMITQVYLFQFSGQALILFSCYRSQMEE